MAALNYPFFPIRHAGGAKLFWGQEGSEFLKVSSLSGNLKSGTVYSELYSGFFGDIVRVGFGATLASVENDSTGEIATLQRQIAGGGLVTLNFQYPIFAIPFSRNFGGAIILSPRVGADLPAAGSSTETVTGSTDLGAELHLIIGTDDGKLSFPFYLRTAYILGTEQFQASIDRTSNFGYFFFNGGIQYEVVKITYSGIIGGNKDVRELIKPMLSFSFIKSIK